MSTLPYRAEYAKSGRSACKGCKLLIADQSIRLAIMVQSSFFDGLQPNWHHMGCFFTRTKCKSVDEIAHFQSLRWADQEELRAKIEGNLNNLGLEMPDPTFKKKGKKATKRGAASSASTSDLSMPKDILDYTLQYAKSGRSKCAVCQLMIDKNEMRISKKDFEGDTAKRYGPVERWHHVDCFIKARSELNFFAAASVLPGYNTMAPEDQEILKTKLPPLRGAVEAATPPKKPKVDDSGLMDLMKNQNEELFKTRDELLNIPRKDLITLLEHNKQDVPEGADRILDRLADIMTFGNLMRCPKCSTGQVVFRSGVGYQCLGYITDWTKCDAVYDKPKRSPFKILKSLKSSHQFLSTFHPKIQDRAFKKAEIPSTSSATSGSMLPRLPLFGLELIVHKTMKDPEDIKKLISELGGKVRKDFDKTVAAVISQPNETTKTRLLKVIKQAKDADVPVVTEDLLTALSATSTRGDVITLFRDKTCSSWGSNNIESKLPVDVVDGAVSKSVYPSKSSKSIFKSEMGTQKVTLKDGLLVDPDSKLSKKAHVYKSKGNDIYSVVLSLTDLQAQKNSFYKLQVLESDKGSRYWLFRSWGRIGTTIGGNKTEEYATLHEACCVFEHLFEEKSGNQWNARHNFVKVPAKMMMLEVVHGSEAFRELKIDASSNLSMPVQSLMTLIFDIEAMKQTMLEFELDLNKMPLGKLSQNQITSAFSLLTELQRLRQDGADRTLILDRTNRFYTLVPHDFGIDNPPILDNDTLINQKIEMLNNLMDIEIAYKLLESAGESTESPIDAHYKKLKTNINVLDKKSSEFADILKYVKNTHADTHRNYELVVEEVFKVEREGEAQRYKTFKKLPNRMLLWHGSRLTNFAGILSQGLRIAPPEAPVTGYMFGKGIYFADMVSKSANYCNTSSDKSTGCLLLCEVALGKMQELKQATNVVKPSQGYHSVKGLGLTQPDPNMTSSTATGAVIPLGKPKRTNVRDATLLYNEYIVYDVRQVNVQYLVKMNFKFAKY